MRYLLISITALIVHGSMSQDSKELIPTRFRVGNVVVATRVPTLHSEVVLGTDKTVYVMTLLGNGNKETVSISRPRSVKALFSYRGWPYILDKSGRVLALDVSTSAIARSKRPAFLRRMLRRIPYAAIVGGGFVGVGELFSMMGTSELQQASNFWIEFGTGTVGYYIFDGIRTFLIRPHRHLATLNLFTYPIATGIKEVKWEAPNDSLLIPKKPTPGAPDLHISDLAPPFTSMSECFFALTGITER